MQIKKNIPLIMTDQMDNVRDFYSDNFGFRPVFDNGDYLCMQSTDGVCEISFMKPTCDETKLYPGTGVTFCLEVEDVDAEYHRLQERGIPFIQSPKDNPWGDRSTIAVDPIGIGVYIYKTTQPTPEYAQFVKD